MQKQDAATGRIQVIQTPVGEAPLYVRNGWLRCEELPCYPFIGYLPEKPRGVVTDEPVEKPGRGVCVPQDQALEILMRCDKMAANYWIELGFGKPGQNFFFRADEIKVISGVEEQNIIVADDYWTGRMELPGR